MREVFNKTRSVLAGAILGSIVTLVVYNMLADPAIDLSQDSAESDEKKPLYWVAPMNPDYKRDKPGKSPMGMDLIAVYADGGGAADAGPGTIRISPDVVNNLGVRSAKAVRQDLSMEIQTVGYVQYDEDQLVHIHPRIKGWIEKLYVKASGDPVIEGQPLYDIYSPELVNAQEELVLALGRKNERLLRAAESRLRALQLPEKVISELRESRQVKQTVTFFSPKSGVIDHFNVREGFYITPGQTLMSIGVLDPVWVEAEVFERQASVVEVGIPVTMTLDYLPGREWQGEVDYVYPTLDAKTRTLKVRLRFDNKSEELKPNMFAEVVIHASSTQDTLVVPREAVIRSGSSDRVVLALGEGQFKSIKVKLGRLNEQYAEILAGLDVGESVVTSAQFLLDSESSKTSDFKRMHNMSDADMSTPKPQQASDNRVTVNGVVNSLMPAHRMLNVSRGPIEQWNRPAATVDFIASEEVDMSALSEGVEIKFTFYVDQGQFVITDIQSNSGEASDNHANHQE